MLICTVGKYGVQTSVTSRSRAYVYSCKYVCVPLRTGDRINGWEMLGPVSLVGNDDTSFSTSRYCFDDNARVGRRLGGAESRSWLLGF